MTQQQTRAMIQTQTFAEFVSTRFGGVLRRGTHAANGQACALEALNAYHDRYWTDDPDMARIWDLRPLNDAPWLSNAERTAHLLPLLQAYDGCRDWPLARQQAVVERIVVETVRQFVSAIPGLSAEVRQRCRECGDLDSAISGARGAYAEASTKSYRAGFGAAVAAAAARAARYAADAAEAVAIAVAFDGDDLSDARARDHYAYSACAAVEAAEAAVDAAAFTTPRTSSRAVLVTACDIWLAAARA